MIGVTGELQLLLSVTGQIDAHRLDLGEYVEPAKHHVSNAGLFGTDFLWAAVLLQLKLYPQENLLRIL
eukprot:COSAG02_NODE_7239_length_3100_cov_310.313229_3_plen_68_part_00